MRLRFGAGAVAIIALVVGVYTALAPSWNAQPVPDLHFVDGGSRARSLSEFRGRTVLLNVWATWCAPCREEMPALDRLQSKLGGPAFQVLALSVDQKGTDVVQKFYADVGVRTLDLYIDASARVPFQLGAKGLPMTVLIDPEGRELGRRFGPANWDSARSVDELRQLLRSGQKGQ